MNSPAKYNFTRKIQIQLVLLAALLGFLVAPKIMVALNTGRQTGDKMEESIVAPTTNTQEANQFARLNLDARSAYVWDIHAHKELFNFRGYEALPLASVTKVMMAVVSSESLPESTQVTITADDLKFDGDQGLVVQEKWRLYDLINLTLVSSSNDGASALAAVAGAKFTHTDSTPAENKVAFISAMNNKARAIGLTQTKFLNESGLDLESYQSGASGSARDMARLFEYVYRRHPTLLSATAKGDLTITSDSNITHHVMNTDAMVNDIPGIIASKTGFTDLAGGNLVVILDIGIDHPVAISVLGSTKESRFSDMQKLIDATVSTITEVPYAN